MAPTATDSSLFFWRTDVVHVEWQLSQLVYVCTTSDIRWWWWAVKCPLSSWYFFLRIFVKKKPGSKVDEHNTETIFGGL